MQMGGEQGVSTFYQFPESSHTMFQIMIPNGRKVASSFSPQASDCSRPLYIPPGSPTENEVANIQHQCRSSGTGTSNRRGDSRQTAVPLSIGTMLPIDSRMQVVGVKNGNFRLFNKRNI